MQAAISYATFMIKFHEIITLLTIESKCKQNYLYNECGCSDCIKYSSKRGWLGTEQMSAGCLNLAGTDVMRLSHAIGGM